MMQMMMTLACRQELILGLGLESEFFESVLVRSEKLLKMRRYQRGLRLLRQLDAEPYHSVLDFLLAVFAPSWGSAIEAFYADRGPKLGELVEWGTIDALDQALAVGIVELAAAYAELEREGWVKGREPAALMCKFACDATRIFVAPHFPAAA